MSGFGSNRGFGGGGSFGGGFQSNTSSNGPAHPAFQPSLPPPPNLFGAANAPHGSNLSTTGVTTFGSTPSQFAAPASTSGLSFGSSPNVVNTIGSGNGSVGIFGQTSASNTAFGQASTNSGPFGQFSSNMGSTTGGGFGSLSNQSPAAFGTNFAGPFNTTSGSSTGFTPAVGYPQTVSFGMSSNVATTNSSAGPFAPGNNTTVGFGMTTTSSAIGPFGTSATTVNPSTTAFSTPTPTGPFHSTFPQRMGPTVDDDGMADDDWEVNGSIQQAPLSNHPFGMSTSFPLSTTQNVMWNRSEPGVMTSTPPFATSANSTTAASKKEMESNLAKLKEKLAEKIRKREEKKKRDAEEAAKKSATSLSADNDASQSISQSTLSIAQRNAERFASSKDSTLRSQLPPDLQFQHTEVAATTNALRNSGGRADRENLEDAVSLVGTCQSMCPDEELLRRERESDIQLLERPVPDGKFHPVHWTLRDTMVKRFRRSAADYKLDVPEWVRPPDVLERVCSYLEEWVMERDRQGPDPRYNGSAPPSLDVYQFIWDRTRMVRKDFILQNYIGTNGMCDARAVRCHERIARWHCMCEHQLSHISDFVTMQSQQNIQELGQTMKTLNQYYDDVLCRSLIEVPENDGRETRTDLDIIDKSYQSEVVQGANPVDFDGSPLVNDVNNVNKNARLIGSNGIRSPQHGTAEPEMRGLYVLITLDNDGGMEVLKYAARLYQERPEIYHSTPVQLALSVYKAKNDHNYARFFSILRSDSTPYLFACLMFKHVEYMRKYAIYICSKSYGGRDQNNVSTFDEYPLKTLTYLLCFEDDDETRAACQHYNITVGDLNGVETIFWRRSKFKEPKDAEKGTVISLRPNKMMKIIEGKLKGATRLAVCRGDRSGDGAFLSTQQIQARRSSTSENQLPKQPTNPNNAIAAAIHSLQEKEEQRKVKLREVIQARLRQEEEEIESQKHRRNEEERQRREEKIQRQVVLQKEYEQREKKERERLHLEKRRQEMQLIQEKERAKIELEMQERQKQIERDRQSALLRDQEEKAREIENKRRRDEEERKRELLLQEQKRRKLELLRLEQEELKRREVEQIRLEELRRLEEKRIQEQEERRQMEVQAYLRQQELEERALAAKKKILLQRLFNKTKHLFAAEKSKETLISMNTVSTITLASPTNVVKNGRSVWSNDGERFVRMSLRRILEISLRQPIVKPDFSEQLAKNLSLVFEKKLSTMATQPTPCTLLFKVVVMMPSPNTSLDISMCGLIQSFMSSRFNFENVCVCGSSSVNVRIVFTDGRCTQSDTAMYDAAFITIPPPWSDVQDNPSLIEDLTWLVSPIDHEVPRVIVAFSEKHKADLSKVLDERLLLSLDPGDSRKTVIRNVDISQSALDQSLSECIPLLVSALTCNDPQRIERISVERMFFKCMDVLWVDGFIEKWEDLADQAFSAIFATVEEIDVFCAAYRKSQSVWPTEEFSVDGMIPDYFGKNVDLPSDWASTTSRTYLETALNDFVDSLRGSLSNVIQRCIWNAPYQIHCECEYLFDRRLYKRCIQRALLWRVESRETEGNCLYMFLPSGVVDQMVETGAIRHCKAHSKVASHSSEIGFPNIDRFNSMYYSVPQSSIQASVDNLIDDIDMPRLPSSAQNSALTEERQWSNSTISKNQELTPQIQMKDLSGPSRRSYKRRHYEKSDVSQALSKSISFTKKLKKMLEGREVKDMILGNGKNLLSTALQGAPPP